MLSWIRNQAQKLTGARQIAAGGLGLYIVGWLTDRALTLFWESFLERQVPPAFRQMSAVLNNDLAAGMALMAAFVLFVPPTAQLIFQLSSSWSRAVTIWQKRLSKHDYLSQLADEALDIAKKARSMSERARDRSRSFPSATPYDQEGWEAHQKREMQESLLTAQEINAFNLQYLSRANFIIKEFAELDFLKDVPLGLDHVINYHSWQYIANTLEHAAYKARAALVKNGYLIKEDRPDESQ